METKNHNFIRHILLSLLLLFAIAAVSSCGGGSSNGGDGGGTSGGGGSPTIITGPDGAKLTIPNNAVSPDTTYRIARNSDGAPSTDGLILLSPIYEVTPHSQTFSENALIEIPYDQNLAPGGSVPFMLRADAGGQWQAFGNARLSNGTAKGDISSLSYYAIGVCAQDFSSPGDCPFNSDLRLELLDSTGNAIPVQYDSNGFALPVITVDQPTRLNFSVSWTRPADTNRTDNIWLSLSGGGQLLTSPYRSVEPNIVGYILDVNVDINPATVSGASTPNGKIVRMRASVYGSYLAFVGPPIGFQNIQWEMQTEIAVRVRYAGVQPTITQQPANQAVTAGQTATFPVAASGTNLTYQWQRSNDNGQTFGDISGATAASYTTAATALSDNGAMFLVRVCQAAACIYSGAATLAVTASASSPTFTQQPASMAVVAGETASFTAVAAGPPAPAVQWYKFDGYLGIPVGTLCSSSGNSTACTYTTPPLTLADSGSQYYAVATNSVGSVQSNTVTATVTSAPVAPSITTQPTDATVCAGSNATFSVVANGTAPLSYQWRRNGVNITGANVSSYTRTNAQLSDNGATFSVVVSNTAGSVTSNNAILTVTSCATYTVGGTVTGLSGTGLVLQNNGGDNLAVSGNGAFTFAAPLANGAGYAVTVLTQPSGQNCTVTNGSGTISGANVTNVAVTCTNSGSGTVNLPRTGQTTSYAAGDDGNLQKGVAWPSPRFADNGNGTVTDNLTGLMWTQDANTPGPVACTPATTKTWQGALDHVACLNTNSYLGYNDWRLPNVNELESLANAEQINLAAWLNAQGFSFVGSGYWSSTTAPSDIAWAWRLDIAFGYAAWTNKTGESHGVWPVRAGQQNAPDSAYPANLPKTGQTTSYAAGDDGDLERGVAWPSTRFAIDGTGNCVTDNLTGLMWVRTLDSTRRTWVDALIYANNLTLCGYSDWRLPNIIELKNLVYNHGQSDPYAWLNAQGFSLNTDFWSSTTVASVMTSAWTNFGNSGKTSPFSVWSVRGGQ